MTPKIQLGGDPNPLSYIPIVNPVLLGQPIIDWEYSTEPLNNSGFAFTNQVFVAEHVFVCKN